MNRPELVSEPSMEDILASIRRIISDEDGGAAARARGVELRPADTGAGLESGASPADSRGSQFAEDDVLDLTNELVFTEGQRSTEPQIATEPQLAEEAGESKQAAEGSKHSSRAAPAAEAAARDEPVSSDGARQSSMAPSAADAASAAPSSRPLWSRRALPRRDARTRTPEATGHAAPAGQGDKAPRAAEAAEVKNGRIDWPEDIQLPVPEHGPVPLMEQLGGKGWGFRSSPASGSASKLEGDIAGADGRSSQTSLKGGSGMAAEEKAVAALARTLANAAAAGLQDDELADARDVDFQHLPDDRRTEVSSKFADAMAAEHPPLRPELFALPDTAGRAEARFKPPPAKPVSGSSASGRETFFEQSLRAPLHSAAEDKIAPGDLPDAGPAGPGAAPSSARFLGAASAALPAASAYTLEDCVREMLRPMLVQWLNEHMPRILENAIREEIATRGLLPRAGVSWDDVPR